MGSSGQNELRVLLVDEVTINGYVIKPWTVKRFGPVYPVAKAIVLKLKEAGLTWDNLETFFQDKGLDILPEIFPEIPPLIAATLDIPLEEAENLDWATAAAICLTIFGQNLEPLKNFSSLAPAILKGARTSTPSP